MLHWNITGRDLCRVGEGLQKELCRSFCSPSTLRQKSSIQASPLKNDQNLAFTGYAAAASD